MFLHQQTSVSVCAALWLATVIEDSSTLGRGGHGLLSRWTRGTILLRWLASPKGIHFFSSIRSQWRARVCTFKMHHFSHFRFLFACFARCLPIWKEQNARFFWHHSTTSTIIIVKIKNEDKTWGLAGAKSLSNVMAGE